MAERHLWLAVSFVVAVLSVVWWLSGDSYLGLGSDWWVAVALLNTFTFGCWFGVS